MATPTTSSSPRFQINALPENEYDSFEDAEAALHAWNREEELDVTRAHNKKNKLKEIRQRDYQCDRYGKTQNTRRLSEEDRVRVQRGTSKTGCSMKIRLEAVDPDDCDGKWKVFHLAGSIYHNHPPSEEPSVHPRHRRRDMQQLTASDLSTSALVASQTAVGISPQTILATLRHAAPGITVTAKDISNRKDADRRNDLANDTPTEVLLKKLTSLVFFNKFEINPDTNRLRYLFWSHPGIKKFYAWNSNVLILDCTYKTNAYDLPLLNVIAMTNMNSVLPVAQCWLPGEKEEDFVWALRQLQSLMASYEISWSSIIITDRDLACMNAIDRLFPGVPSLVCRWHMNRNVLAKTRTIFGQVEVPNPAPGQDKYENTVETDQFMELYFDAVESPTEGDFNARSATIRSANVEMADYLDRHWWRYRTKLVRCWISQYLHFGYRDTSPVEGTHAKCKRWLETSRGDLLTVFNKLLPWWEACIKSISLGTELDVSKVSHVLQDERYSAVVMLVSRYALNQTSTLWKEALQVVRKRKPCEPCTGVFRRSNGRPCVHELIEIIMSQRQQKLQVQHFHPHWLTRRGRTESSETRVLEPAPMRTNRSSKRRKTSNHKKNHGNFGTAREPTYSERVDLNHPTPDPEQSFTFSERQASDTIATGTNNSIPYQRLPSLAAILSQDSDEKESKSGAPPYFHDFLPTRSWDFAGRRPF